MCEREAKLQRLNVLRKAVPSCSKSSLAAILDHIAEHGLPELNNRKQMREAAEQQLKASATYGPAIFHKNFLKSDGGTVSLPMVNFYTALSAACKVKGSFSQCLLSSLAGKPTGVDTPWNLILYSDECLPANALGRAAKKVWVVYAAFKEFGRQALSHTQHWLVLGIVRSSIVATLEGHMGQVMKVLLEHIFSNNVASPLVGVLLHGPGSELIRLHFQIGFFVQDGASQKVTFGLKGDSGSNYCLKCCDQIVFLLEAEEDEEKAVLKTICKKDMVLTTDEEALKSFDRLSAKKGVCTPQEFQQWEQCTGWTFSHEGILASPCLRNWLQPCSQYVHDYMHGMASNGCLNIGMFLVLEHLQSEGLPAWSAMQDMISMWHFPQALHKVGALSSLFTSAKVESYRKAGKLKVTASEVLCLYPILQHHVQMIENKGGKSAATQAFLNLCHMMDLLLATSIGGVNGLLLDTAAENVLASFKLAKWGNFCIKKFHWMLHYGDELEAHEMLLPCWTMERKHKDITLLATRVQNLKNFEEGLLVEVLSQQLHHISQWQREEASLEKKHLAPKKLVAWLHEHLGLRSNDIFSSKCIVLLGGGVASVNDVVLLSSGTKWEAGQMLLNFAIGRETWSLLKCFVLQTYDSKSGKALWHSTDQWVTVPAAHILAAVIYSQCQAGYLTLIPYHLR